MMLGVEEENIALISYNLIIYIIMNSPKKNAFPILKNLKLIQTSDG